jgi:hypothetical protein
MIPVLLALALQAPESLHDKVLRLAREPAKNRDEILRLGPGAIRPLLEVRSADIEPLLLELKFGDDAGRPWKALLEKETFSIRVTDIALPSAIELLSRPRGWPMTIDPALGDAGEKRVTLDLQNRPLADILRATCAATGLDYAVVRGRFFFSTPERLWSAPPAKAPRALTPEEVDRVQQLVAKLDDDALDVRDAAAKEILEMGPGAAAVLEARAGEGGPERRGRVRDLVARLRPKLPPPVFVEKLTVEKQTPTGDEETAISKALAAPIQMRVAKLALPKALKLLMGQTGIVAEIPESDALFTGGFDGAIVDGLYLMTVPYGLDAWLKEGKLVIGPREKAPPTR